MKQQKLDILFRLFKTHIPGVIHKQFHKYHQRRQYSYDLLIDRLKKKNEFQKRIIVIGTPEHGNLGDHAIAKAELLFLGKKFPSIKVVEISGEQFRCFTKEIKRSILPTDKIIITGGGFMGSLWPTEEFMVRNILLLFPDNEIVIFPQTIYFENMDEQNTFYLTSLESYRRHKNLKICARDISTYNFLKEKVFYGDESNCFFIPDIALFLVETTPRLEREGILLCLRADKEKNLTDNDRTHIEQYALRFTNDVHYVDTVINDKVSPSDRNNELEKKFVQFRSARLVITDRLHGMIFAAITGTPCIALDNVSGKVSGVHYWLRSLNYVQCIDSIDQLDTQLEHFMQFSSCEYNNMLKPFYDMLAEKIL